MRNLRILKGIKKFAGSKPIRFAMPGHKGKRAPRFNFYKCDVTELPAIDNLRLVTKAEQDVASILSASKVRFLTGGSTSGIYAMLYAVKDMGKKLVIFRASHKSVYNALKLVGIEPVILDGEYVNGALTYPSFKRIEKAVSDKSVFGALITYPDYYGKGYDINKLYQTLKGKNKLLLVDGAHGGHYKYVGVPYAGDFADVWVDGLHKTMPTLNQGAIVCSNNLVINEKLDEAVDTFSTTSPSYPLLASVEYGVKFMAKKGARLTEKFNDRLDEFKIKLVQRGVSFMENTDVYKLAIDFGGAGYDSFAVEKLLIKRGIHVEMNDGRYLLFMFSALTKKRHLSKLYRSIKRILKRADKKDFTETKPPVTPKRAMPYLKAVNAEYELTDLESAVGKISAENAGLFPPCYPLVVAGEIITREIVSLLSNDNAFGVTDGKIKTVKE